jgi:hypothetical protein
MRNIISLPLPVPSCGAHQLFLIRGVPGVWNFQKRKFDGLYKQLFSAKKPEKCRKNSEKYSKIPQNPNKHRKSEINSIKYRK